MVKLNSKAEFYKPNSAKSGKKVIMAVGAHQDDLEIMAAKGILDAFDEPDTMFIAVVVTNGAGSARSGIYASYTDADMMKVRAAEQKKAAEVGSYGGLYLLNFSSSEVKDAKNPAVAADLTAIIKEYKPVEIYTHNIADKHDTHIAVLLNTLRAAQGLKASEKPAKLYGCEVWRNLDWMPDSDKICFDVSRHENLNAALVSVFDSQIAGGKRYDLATAGRRLANATYNESHAVDEASAVSFAMDITPLMEKGADLTAFISSFIDRFKASVTEKIQKFW